MKVRTVGIHQIAAGAISAIVPAAATVPVRAVVVAAARRIGRNRALRFERPSVRDIRLITKVAVSSKGPDLFETMA